MSQVSLPWAPLPTPRQAAGASQDHLVRLPPLRESCPSLSGAPCLENHCLVYF